MTLEILPPTFLPSSSTSSSRGGPSKASSGRTLKVFMGKDDAAFASKVKKLVGSDFAPLLGESAESFLKLPEFDLVVLRFKTSLRKVGGAFNHLNGSLYGQTREALGAAIRKHARKEHTTWEFHFESIAEDGVRGALVGLEMSQYLYRTPAAPLKPSSIVFQSNGKALDRSLVESARQLGQAVNLSRHLVNLPPNELNPVSYADAIKKLFAKSRTTTVEVWDEKRLAKENLSLLAAVGQGSESPARLVKIRYRPLKSKAARVVFVGKGITFDTGGLDIKPSAAMRLMKKDMGGSASVLGLAHWIETSGLKQNVDFYLALAENSIGSRAFRPGDIYQTRKGLSIEIDNTDAEGRLALADALTVALEDGEPEYLIDLATLTGAGKVALGTELASLFATDDGFLKQLLKASQESEDLSWPMPLWEKYDALYKSSFADHANSGAGGFGGAITAALFLKKFVDPSPVKWAHFDIYSWKDGADGPFADKGGNGQCVQALSRWLESL